jgi:type IV pilus assembly protein PilC
LKVKKKKPVRRSTFLFGNEKDYFAENLSMLLSAGIGVSSAVKVIQEGAKSRSYKKTLGAIIDDLDEGSPLWRAIEGRGILDASYVYMVKVGEASGRLWENLKIVAEQQSKNKSFHSKLNSALIYPGIILSLTFLIGIGVVWFVIPKMSKIFSDMKVQLPLPTRIMVSLGNFITTQPVLFLTITAAVVLFIFVIFFVPGTKKIGQAILFRFPKIKELYQEVEVARFGYVMFSLSDAGIPLTEALQSIGQSTTIPGYKKFYDYLYKSVEEGNSLEKSFAGYKKASKLFPVQIRQMIVAGERSGNLITVLGKISEIYEEKIELTSKNLSVILEPMLLFIVALAVLFLSLAVIMPIYSLVGGLNVQ